MSLAQTYRELEQASSQVLQWRQRYLPSRTDVSRCFEFATYLDIVSTLAAAVGNTPQVVTGRMGAFAGAPATRELYNRIEVGDFIVYFGVCFEGQSGLWHAPDVVVTKRELPDRPLVIAECKHYTGAPLPKVIVMAFVALLNDLLWAVFPGCRKLNAQGLYAGRTLRELNAPNAGNSVCRAFNMCKSRLVITASPSAPMARLESRYEFEISVERPMDP